MQVLTLVSAVAMTLLLCTSVSEAGCPFSKTSSGSGRHHHRHLLQANCVLQVNGQPQTFKACQDLSSTVNAPYNLLWNLTDEGNGSSILSGAINVQSIGWAAFGFPQSPGSGMLGGSALVVKADANASSGASVDDYFLGGYKSLLVKPPGKLNVISASAAKSGNNLMAVYKLRLPSSASNLSASPTDYLMALGQLSPNGALMKHDDSQGVENTINLAAGLDNPVAGLAGAPAAAVPASTAASNAPAAAVALTRAAAEVSGGPPPAAAPTASAPADSGCVLQLNGKSETFTQCKPLMSDSSGMHLYWTLSPDPSGKGSVMTAALRCTVNGWCGWGLPQTPGRMIGSSAVIVKNCATCPSGVSIDKYLLAGKDTSSVVPGTGSLAAQNLLAAKSSDGAIVGLFTLGFPQDPSSLDIATDCLGAHGPVGSGDSLQPHMDADSIAASLNLASGYVAVSATAAVDKETTAHGVVMTVAWAIILPISIATAHSMRNTLGPSAWFQIHRALGAIAFILILAGFALGVYIWTQTPQLDDVLMAHVVLGVLTTGLAILQALAVVARPKPESKLRSYWNHYHHNVGRVAVLAAFANAMLGFKLGNLDWGWYLGLCLIWALIWLLGGAKAFYDHRRARHAAFLKNSSSLAQGGPSNGTELTRQKSEGKYTML